MAVKKKKLEASALTVHIGFWLRFVSNSVSYSFARKVESTGVTVAEWVILRQMYSGDDSTSPSAVSEHTGLTRGAVSKLISRLLEKGLVHRAEAAGDRRYQDIKLTQKAFDLVPELAALADKNDDEFFSVLSKAERKTLTEILQKIVNAHGLKKVPVE
ncbi:MAG TPA: MarR family winged helix-turn-helix transcriptional regulator [Bdellovibrionales bacterium]|jgi:DNA-binding MarR family transcriptional regulator|nr:MarR family winged helix-turn-helix transcriptional regulator [Bdellovibrionales bacterium]